MQMARRDKINMKKSHTKTIIILALLVLGYLGYRYYAYEQSLKLPEKDPFVLGLVYGKGENWR